MKQISIKLTFLVLFMAAFIEPGIPQTSVSGNTEFTTTILPAAEYTGDRFSGVLNPGNMMDLHDISLAVDFTAKISEENDHGVFDFWFSIEPLRIPNLLLSITAGNPEENSALAGVLKYSDYNFSAFKILKASINWYINDSLTATAGRQYLFSGYGYGWNPISFTGASKNPFNPKAGLIGVDAVTLEFNGGNTITAGASGIYRPENYAAGIDYKDIQGFAELTFSFPLIEITIDGLYNYVPEGTVNSFVPSAGTGFMLDTGGIGIYGEGALLEGSRIKYPDAYGNLTLKTSIQFNALAGLQYTFPWDMNIIAEYYYNGEGFSLTERQNYYNLVQAYGSSYLPADTASMMRPGYFSRHYILLYLMQPIYSINTNVSLSVLFSPDSRGLSIMPLFSYEASGNITIEGSWLGFTDIGDNYYSETYFLPVKNMVQLKLKYSF